MLNETGISRQTRSKSTAGSASTHWVFTTMLWHRLQGFLSSVFAQALPFAPAGNLDHLVERVRFGFAAECSEWTSVI